MMKKTTTTTNQNGFTIIELMIAVSIFTIILVMVSVIITGIGNLYQKGINLTRTQDNVQAIVKDMTERLQLGGAPVPYTPMVGDPATDAKAYCFGTIKYSYILDKKLGNEPSDTPYVLWRENRDTAETTCAPIKAVASDLSASRSSRNGTELIARNSRLTELIIGTSSPYSVVVGVAYGDNDLLNTHDSAGTLTHQGIDTRCKGDVGQQFCATAFLSTVVTRRLL